MLFRSQGFTNFYAGFQDIRFTDVQQQGDTGQVTGTVGFVPKGGAEKREKYRFTVIQQDGKLMINDFAQLGPG